MPFVTRRLAVVHCVLSLVVAYANVVVAEEATTAGENVNADAKLTYERDIRPILKAHCFHCHGEDATEGSLDVRLRRLLVTGGDTGAAVVPDHPDKSLLLTRLRSGEMPPEDVADRPTPDDMERIAEWIALGAPTSRPEPADVSQLPTITEEEKLFWSFQSIKRPAVPTIPGEELVSPIDGFILQKLHERGMTFTEPADRTTLLRRICFDLTGLPPTPDQVERFLADQSPDAYARMVDELLASPSYGERWGRHWLDVVGYADSEGYANEDHVRPHAYRYRDYVIRSFQTDKPFDQFIIEQLAGDELIKSPLNNLTPEDAELLVATGFLRTAPDGTSGTVDDIDLAKNEVIAETIKVVTTSLMGMTVGCAQCHDHRYDPIPQSDYYALRAIFDPAFERKKWKNPRQRLVSLYTDEDRARAAEIETQAKAVEAQRAEKLEEYIAATFEKELAKLPEETQPLAREARDTPVKKRTAEQQQLLKKFPSLNVSAGSLYLYDQKAANELKKMADEAKKIRDTKPEEGFIRALTEQHGNLPESFLFHRGDHEQPKQQLAPAGLSIVSETSDLPEIPVDDASLPTSGRRLAFARRLTNPNHPLTARVLVNRIWMHHFGRGIVSTPGDFGFLGSPPTHPELLDWLASEFVSSGWSVKHIHRLMLNCETYQQSVLADPQAMAADPDNEWYGRATLKRLEAEAIRDSMLAMCGVLNNKTYGPPVPVMADRVGRWVLGIENLNAGRPGDVIDMKGDEYRRSVYVQVRRSRPLASLDTFDWPRMSPNCVKRSASTVAPQSLMMLNSDFMLKTARQFSARLREAVPDDQPDERVRHLWELVYSRQPTESELASARQFLIDQASNFQAQAGFPKNAVLESEKAGKDDPTATITPESEALAILCQMVLSSNEFLYVD